METLKKLGIWMDHSIADLIEFSKEGFETKTIGIETIESANAHPDKVEDHNRSESLKHNIENKIHSDYFKKIESSMKNYDVIVLFGPTTAKNELLNLIKDNHHFDKIKVVTVQSDKMTENQIHAFVASYFQKAV